jgi:hypothetical protein
VRTKNARAIDELEAAYMADVKRVHCVVCNAAPPVQCHHPEQGLHFIGIACCADCHGGPGYPHGWHGDKSRWRAAKVTEPRAINETRRRVERLRAGKVHTQATPVTRSRQSRASSPKNDNELLPRIVKRRI